MQVTIRAANITDAEPIARLASELHAYLKRLGYTIPFDFTAAKYIRDGFGDQPAFQGLVALSDEAVIGYLLLHVGYDTDRGRREAYVHDLYVEATRRGQGIGKALMARAADLARSHGAEALWWGVQEQNDAAFRFYESLGAQYVEGVRFMGMDI